MQTFNGVEMRKKIEKMSTYTCRLFEKRENEMYTYIHVGTMYKEKSMKNQRKRNFLKFTEKFKQIQKKSTNFRKLPKISEIP